MPKLPKEVWRSTSNIGLIGVVVIGKRRVLLKMNYAGDDPSGTFRFHPDHGNRGDEALEHFPC